MADTPRVAVILAGVSGECSRLGEEFVPKLMLPLGGKPLLERQLSWLTKAGFDTVVLCLGCKADVIRAHFGDGERWGVRLRYCVEESPLGTAGAVKALGLASLPEDVLILAGEIYGSVDLRRLLAAHDSSQALASLAVTPALNGEARNLVVMGPERRILDFPEGPWKQGNAMVASKLWVIRRSLLHYVPDEGASDFLHDVFPAIVRAGGDLRGYPEAGELVDLGEPDVYERFARRFVRKVPASGAV